MVTLNCLFGEGLERNATEARGYAREIFINDFSGETNRFKNLRAGVRSDGRDSHLGHDFEDAFAERFNEICDCLLRGNTGDDTLTN